MASRYDLDALRAADAESLAWIASFPGATAARIARLARLGLAVEAAAERDGPEREAMHDAACEIDWASSNQMAAAARALIAMQEGR